MRGRGWEFLWIMAVALSIIGRATFGGEGWAWIALVFGLGFLRLYTLNLQLSNNSDKIISDTLANSTDGEFFGHCDPIGEKAIEVDDPLNPGKTRKVTVAAWPEIQMIELGAGRWGLAHKWGGNEHGFLIIATDLLLQLSEKGNIACLGPTWTLRPVHLTLLQSLRRVKPTSGDERSILPDQWWSRLRAHRRFSVKKSAVHLILDPAFPIIEADRLGNPIICLPGADEAVLVNGKKTFALPQRVPLSSLIGDRARLFDMRKEQRQIRDAKIEAVRKWAGDEMLTLQSRVQSLEASLASETTIKYAIEKKGAVLEQVSERIGGYEETGERGTGR